MECVIENRTKSWVPTQRDNTVSDDVIEAYMTGKREGMFQHQRLINDKLMENVEKCCAISGDVFDTLKGNGFNPIDAYLKVNAFDDFDILISVPEAEFNKEEFLEMYDAVSAVETEQSDQYYNVFISFCWVNEYFNEMAVMADGYLLKLGKK